MLEVKALSCVRNDRVLFEGLSLALAPGELAVVEGPNGCGKTTLLRTLCGLMLPEEGEVYWEGEPIRRCRERYTRALAYLGHQDGVKLDLTAEENLRVYAALDGGRPRAAAAEALAAVGLDGHAGALARRLSAGQRRRLAIARLVMHRASLWLLDEPLTALDRDGVATVEELLQRHCNEGGMALISSHHELRLARVSQRVRLG